MPGILNALDHILDKNKSDDDPCARHDDNRSLDSPRRIHNSGNFTLSLNVQKILANAIADDGERPEETGGEKLKSPDNALLKRNVPARFSAKKFEKSVYKSNENLELLPSVQKMLSNLPDADLVLPEKKVQRNNSFLHNAESNARTNNNNNNNASAPEGAGAGDNANSDKLNDNNLVDANGSDSSFNFVVSGNVEDVLVPSSRPLGNYKHTSPLGIASRTPVGRKNLGKHLQVPSESSVGTNSTTSSEVSRPLSLSSLGSCSSSGSSGPHQAGSAYQASAESLDSDSGIQGSADSGIAEESTNFNRKEYDVVAEIIDTETKYVEDLRKVIQDYLQPWKSDPDCYLHQYIPKLFSNMEEIYEFSRSFLDQLREAKLDPSSTAKAFINNTGFSVYSDYCNDYPTTMSTLTELMGNEESARHFKAVQIEKKHDLPLGSYLLKPVQRILRYRLLLERLSDRCDPEHKPVVDLAYTTMSSVATHINNMKRKHEIAVRIQEIQSQLYGWTGPDLTTLGELIAEGSFRVCGSKGRRHVFLFDKLLLLSKCKQDGNFTYKSHIMCSNLMLVEQVRGEPLSFHILPFDNPRLQITLRAKSLQHKREWTGQLKRVIIENYDAAIPNHAQQLLMQLGQDLPEKEESHEMWTPLKKQYSTPHYLERRSRVRQSRDLSSRRAASHDRSFASLTNWRRKSEPNVVQQYDNKTVPSKISKMKKAKESSSTFYTDLSDSETCDAIPAEVVEDPEEGDADYAEVPSEKRAKDVEEEESIEDLVSGIIMEHEEFNKALNRRKRILRESETDPNICAKPEKDPVTSKADSLPRSFQLNDQIDGSDSNISRIIKSNTLEIQISNQLDNNNDHPEHKIYRKSTIRLSFLQKYNALKDRHKKYAKQISKTIGERIANPDYEDPQKLLASMTSLNQSTISIASSKTGSEDIEFEAPEELDMTINEHEVLTELDNRLRENRGEAETNKESAGSEILNSSQNCEDGYYESILEEKLSDGNVERCDSFKKPSNEKPETKSSTKNGSLEAKRIQRPNRAPPPVPAKPAKLINSDLANGFKKSTNTCNKNSYTSNINNSTVSSVVSSSEVNFNGNRTQSKGWVKTVVGRFE